MAFELTMLISAAVMFAQSAFVNVRNGGYAKGTVGSDIRLAGV